MKKSIVIIMLLLSLFFACTGSVFAEPVYGGDLVIGVSSELEPASLDAQIDPYDITESVSLMLSDQLVTMTESGEFVPSLATSIEVAPDGTKWTFKLREDVVFSDGTPFNAEAVKVNIDRIMDPATKSSSLAGKMGQAKFISADVVDDYTIVLNYSGLVATIWQSLAYMPIWSPTALANSGSSFNQVLTSCGPFVLEEFVKGSHIKLVKNEKYNGKAPTQLHDGPAYLDSITLKFVGEDAILAEALGSGEVDLVYRISSQYIAPYEKNDNFTVVEAYEHGTGSLFVMNQEKAPLDDVRVRQALMYAYDLNEMNDRLFDGKGMIGKGLLTSKISCFYEEGAGAYSYDPEKSKALLDEAGWILNESTGIREKDGAKLEIEGIAINPDRLAQLEYMAIKFKEVGVLLTPQLIPGNMQIEKAQNGDFQIMYEELGGTMPDNLYRMWHSENHVPGGWSWSGMKNDEVDALLIEASNTSDEEARCVSFKDAQKILVDNAVALYGVNTPSFYAMSNTVKGFRLVEPVGIRFIANDIYLEK